MVSASVGGLILVAVEPTVCFSAVNAADNIGQLVGTELEMSAERLIAPVANEGVERALSNAEVSRPDHAHGGILT
jgi:hypothetical protein